MKRKHLLVILIASTVAIFSIIVGLSFYSTQVNPSAETQDDRSASIIVEKIRACIQNNTSKTLSYEFLDAVDDRDNKIKSGFKTFGPGAFVCAASDNFWTEELYAYVGETTDNLMRFRVINASNTFALEIHNGLNAKHTGGYGVGLFSIKANETFTKTVGNYIITANTNGVLRTFDGIEAYLMDIRLTDK